MLSAGLRLGYCHRIPRLLGRRRGHAPVVAGEGLAVTNGEVDATRCLESFVCLLGPLGDWASARLAEWMTAGCAVRASIRDSREAHVAYSRALCIDAGYSVKLSRDFGQVIALADGADYPVF